MPLVLLRRPSFLRSWSKRSYGVMVALEQGASDLEQVCLFGISIELRAGVRLAYRLQHNRWLLPNHSGLSRRNDLGGKVVPGYYQLSQHFLLRYEKGPRLPSHLDSKHDLPPESYGFCFEPANGYRSLHTAGASVQHLVASSSGVGIGRCSSPTRPEVASGWHAAVPKRV